MWMLQIYIYLVARRDVLRFEMSHRQKITATVWDQISASSGPSRKEVRGGSWLSQCNLREAVLMNKDVDESHVVYKMFRKFNILFIKGILSHWIRFGAWIKKNSSFFSYKMLLLRTKFIKLEHNYSSVRGYFMVRVNLARLGHIGPNFSRLCTFLG